MIGIVKNSGNDKIIRMGQMKPLQVGEIVHHDSSSLGHIVMRTASTDTFEVMDLSRPEEDGCWECGSNIRVRLLRKGESIQIRLYNN